MKSRRFIHAIIAIMLATAAEMLRVSFVKIASTGFAAPTQATEQRQ